MLCPGFFTFFIGAIVPALVPLVGASSVPSVTKEEIFSSLNSDLNIPNLENLNESKLNELKINDFLNLWKNHISFNGETAEPWTILAPENGALSSEFVSSKNIEDKLLNHLITGTAVQLGGAILERQFSSASNSEIQFSKKQDKYLVNGIPLVGHQLAHGEGIIYVIQKPLSLPTSEIFEFVPFNDNKSKILIEEKVENKELTKDIYDVITEKPKFSLSSAFASTSQPEIFHEKSESAPKKIEEISIKKSIDSAPRPTRFDKFKPKPEKTSVDSNVVPLNMKLLEGDKDIEIFSEPEEFSPKAAPSTFEFLETENMGEILEPVVPVDDFVSSMMQTLDNKDLKASEFIHHFKDTDIGQYLSPDKNYTAIIPKNGAFYDYYPIDWGFNPFNVENFTRDVLLNHILEGDIPIQSFEDYVEMQTVEGRTIKVSKDREGTLLLNGITVPTESEIEIPFGRLYFISELLFVNYERVFALRDEYPFLETAPLLGSPWPSSPFLSHLLKRLQEIPNTKIFLNALRDSNIAYNVKSNDENLTRLSYSAFIPTDDSLKKFFDIDSMDSLDKDRVNKFLLDHIVPGYLFEEDFEDGFNLLSLSENVIPIKIENGTIRLGNSTVILPQIFVYNLGTIFLIDRPLGKISELESTADILEPEILGEESSFQIGEPLTEFLISENDGSTLQRLSEPLTAESSSFFDAEPLEVSSSTSEPEQTIEVRTEISYSRQIDGGPRIPITREQMEEEMRRMRINL